MKKKTNHKLVTRQNKTSEPVDKTEEQNPGEDGRMRRSAENGASIYDPDGSAVKPGKEGTYQKFRQSLKFPTLPVLVSAKPTLFSCPGPKFFQTIRDKMEGLD